MSGGARPTGVVPAGLGPDADGRVLIAGTDGVTVFGSASTYRAEPLPCPGARIEPGQVNAHTHIYSALAPLGMPPPEPPPENFLQILERVWWRLDRALDEPSLRASARLYAAESLRAGTTTLIDHHESPSFIEGSLDVLADACQEIGIRAVLCYGATERNGGREEARRGLAECRRFLRENRRPLVSGVVGLHASFTVSDETLREAAELCRELDTVLHVHLAEDGVDVEDARERGYPGPLERLLHFGALPPGSILAHAVHCDAEQVRRAADAGVWIVQNPRSNRGNRVGYPKALTASPRVAVGTDGYPACMDDEARALEEEARKHGDEMDDLLRRLEGGWKLAEERLGRPLAPLQEGTAADAVAREVEDADGGNDGGGVRHVLVAGRRVVEDGRLLTADLEEIRARAKEEAPRVWERLPPSS